MLTQPVRASRRVPWVALAIAGVGVAAVAVAAILIVGKSEPKPATEPAYIVVERGSDGTAKPVEQHNEPIGGNQATEPIANEPVPIASEPKRGSASTPKLPKTTDLDALTRTFGKQSPAITGCFKQHPNSTEQVSVRIQIDTRGAVKAAEVLPASVGASPLGECIANVTRKTDFGPQPKPASFRVPLVKNER